MTALLVAARGRLPSAEAPRVLPSMVLVAEADPLPLGCRGTIDKTTYRRRIPAEVVVSLGPRDPSMGCRPITRQRLHRSAGTPAYSIVRQVLVMVMVGDRLPATKLAVVLQASDHAQRVEGPPPAIAGVSWVLVLAKHWMAHGRQLVMICGFSSSLMAPDHRHGTERMAAGM